MASSILHHLDGHNLSELVDTFYNLPSNSDKPQVVIAHTIKGNGVKYMENSRLWHLGYLHGADAQATIEEIIHYEHA